MEGYIMNADRVIALACGFVGAFWALNGWFNYGFWINKGPGPGFLPVIFGLLTCTFCVMRLLRPDKDAEPVDKRALVPIGAIIAFTVSIYIVGFLASAFLFMACWLKSQGSYSYRFSLVLAALVTFFIWLVFEYWLQVPFPTGMIKL